MNADPDFGPELTTETAEVPPTPRSSRPLALSTLPTLPMPVSKRAPAEPLEPAEDEDQGDDGEDYPDDYDDTADYDDDGDDDGDDYDDGEFDDEDGEFDEFEDEDPDDYGEDPRYVPDQAEHRSARPDGLPWDSWLARPGKPDPRKPKPDPGPDGQKSLSDYYDAVNAGTYTDSARKAFVDRSGGRGAAVRARLKRRRDDDNDREVYRARSGGVAVLAVAGVALVVVVIVLFNVNHSSPLLSQANSSPHPTALTTTAPIMAGPATTEGYPHATADCYATKTPTNVVGAGPGDPSSGPGVILGFEWAYYSDRSGARARDWVATDADVPDAPAIQSGIDSVPTGTRYCVHITKSDSDTSGNTWNVSLSEQFPDDKAPMTWPQLITTRTEGGRVLITAIRKAN
ncbi:hypothetical protein [Nocardia sp. NPDC059228]|uniref:hypothetical protein n=1 Tax=Nocardia sp. NPDC059228 TaxID=3346777 RepID=UPI0036AFDA8B